MSVGDTVGATVPTGEGRHHLVLGEEQQGGGDGGFRERVQDALQCGLDDVGGGGTDEGHEAEPGGIYEADSQQGRAVAGTDLWEGYRRRRYISGPSTG